MKWFQPSLRDGRRLGTSFPALSLVTLRRTSPLSPRFAGLDFIIKRPLTWTNKFLHEVRRSTNILVLTYPHYTNRWFI